MTDYEKIDKVKALIIDVLGKIGVPGEVEFEDSITKGLIFNISSPDSYLLIGRQGATLHALQVVVQGVVARQLPPDQQFRFSLDVDDYKRKREWYLKETAKQAAEQVKRTGKSVSLESMPNYERRFIHAYLQEHNPEVYTESIGHEPHRKIVIRLRK